MTTPKDKVAQYRAELQALMRQMHSNRMGLRAKLAELKERWDIGEDAKEKGATELRKAADREYARLGLTWDGIVKDATAELRRARRRPRPTGDEEQAVQAAWSRVKQMVDSKKEPAEALAALEDRLKEAADVDDQHVLTAVHREGKDYLRSRFGDHLVPKVLLDQLDQLGPEDVREATVAESEFEQGAYRLQVSRGQLDHERDTDSPAPVLVEWDGATIPASEEGGEYLRQLNPRRDEED